MMKTQLNITPKITRVFDVKTNMKPNTFYNSGFTKKYKVINNKKDNCFSSIDNKTITRKDLINYIYNLLDNGEYMKYVKATYTNRTDIVYTLNKLIMDNDKKNNINYKLIIFLTINNRVFNLPYFQQL